jgi:hypothetical protein
MLISGPRTVHDTKLPRSASESAFVREEKDFPRSAGWRPASLTGPRLVLDASKMEPKIAHISAEPVGFYNAVFRGGLIHYT